jgi:D-serine deaminase-like pyridoxal phosphate-dependent protein
MFEKIIEPTLIIDQVRCLANISRMAKKAADYSLVFRPHFKTHQSLAVASWFRDFGVDKITVSSVSMAGDFIGGGWKDITIAFPFNPREAERINQLDPSARINITFENTDAIELASPILKREVGAFIKIDTGYGRTGIIYPDFHRITNLIKSIERNPLMIFRGFIIHAGHTYQCRSKDEVLLVHRDSLEKIGKLREKYLKSFADLTISYGDTPSCSLADDFTGIDEMRPGNFVYYDLMQEQIGSCTTDNIAVAVACPVVAKHPQRDQLVVHGGAVHFSKEYMIENGNKIFGKAVAMNQTGIGRLMNGIILTSLSQEHGIVQVKDRSLLESIKIGDLLYFLPVHSCLTADILKKNQQVGF